MPKIAIRYRWRVQERGKWHTTAYHCTEEFIKATNPEAVAVENTREVLELSDDALLATSMSHFNTGCPGSNKAPS